MGKARAFDTEDAFVKAVEEGSIKKGEKTVVILRYLGPKGGPGECGVPFLFLGVCGGAGVWALLGVGRDFFFWAGGKRSGTTEVRSGVVSVVCGTLAGFSLSPCVDIFTARRGETRRDEAAPVEMTCL